MSYAASAVAALGILLLIGAAAFLGARFAVPKAPISVRSVGPTLTQLEQMGQLTSMRVHVTDILSAEGEGYRGSWLIKGDALLSCDLSKAEIADINKEEGTATIRIPQPKVLSPRVDHERTKTWSVEKATWIPWKWGDQNVFRDSAMFHSQKLVEESAQSPENLALAKAQAELTIRKCYELIDWRLKVEWK